MQQQSGSQQQGIEGPDPVTEVGTVLGLHPEFIKDLRKRGVHAALDRAEMLDDSGAQAKTAALVMRFGMILDGMAAKRKQLSEDDMLAVAAKISRAVGVNPALGIRIIGNAHEVAQRVLQYLSESDYGDQISTGRTEPGS